MSLVDGLPDRQVRVRARASDTPPPHLIVAPARPLPDEAQIVCLGSRLAPALGAVLETRGYRRIRTDAPHPALPPIEPEAEDYAAFGTLAGPSGSSAAVEQLLRRCLGEFRPADDRWPQGDVIIDPFRPGLRYPARSDREFDVLGERFLTGLRSALRRAQAVVIALDTIEICEAIADGAVLPVWPEDTHADRYRIRSLSMEEIGDQLKAAIGTLRRISPDVQILLMVSPEPIAVTIGARHVLLADTLAKATLRLALERLATADGVFYVPALELAGAMQVPADVVTTDAAFLSALAEAVISAEIDASTPATASAEPDAPAPPAARKVRGRRARAAASPAGEAQAEPVAPVSTPEPEQPDAVEAKPRRRRARSAAAEAAPRAVRAATTRSPKPTTAAGDARRAKRAARTKARAEVPVAPAPVVAAPVDESGYKEPGRKRGKRALAKTKTNEETKSPARRRTRRKTEG